MIRNLIAPAIATTVAAGGLAAPAHADQYDFISYLDNNGVYYSSISDMIDLGKMVCMSARRTGSADPAVNGLAAAGFTSSIERGAILIGAANNMCPDIWPALNAHAAQIAAQQAAPPPPPVEPVGDY